MEIVVPQRIEAVAAIVGRSRQPGLLRFVLRDDDDRPPGGRFAGAPANRGEDVLFRPIENRLRRVETEAVEVEFLDPVAGVLREELANGPGAGAVEVDRFAPFILIASL
jgi:hypothetical protein